MKRNPELRQKIDVTQRQGGKIVIALDFDGTLVTHEWPNIGKDIGAFKFLIDLKEANPEIEYILWSVRSGHLLNLAAGHCRGSGLKLWGVNQNPTQSEWSASPKAHAHIYVDDVAIGAPLIPVPGKKPYINWGIMSLLLADKIKQMKGVTG